jgi:probable F420-dependent oxidoreductase
VGLSIAARCGLARTGTVTGSMAVMAVPVDSLEPGRAPGVVLPLRGFGAAEVFELGRIVEELGYDTVWVSELAAYDAVAVACALAVTTERIRIGTAIIPFTTRTGLLHAMSASTLGHLAPGRSIVGYGLSTKPIIEGWHGQPLPGAVTAATDVFTVVDQALSGEPTDHEGTVTSSHGIRLEAPSPIPPLRYVGALGPKMRRLAGERCDGLLLNFAPCSSLLGTAAAERPADRPFELALPIRIAVGDDLSGARTRFRREAASYLRVPQYARSLRELGWAEVVEEVGGRGSLNEMAAALPDSFVDDLGIFGDVAGCRGRLAAMRADGVTPLLVPIVDPGDAATYEATIRALAPSA